MRLAKIVLALALAIYWPVAASHCLIEQVGGIDFLSCCNPEGVTTPHTDNDCHQNLCTQFESGLYKTENATVVAPALTGTLMLLTLLEASDSTDSDARQTTLLDSSPPELSVIWQFSHRTALPVRAPSFVS